MNTSNAAQDVVRALARQYGIDKLELGTTGTAAIRLNDGAEVCLEEVKAAGKLFVYIEMGDLPVDEEVRAIYLERLLSMNCLEHGTGSGVFSIDAATETVLLQTGLMLEELEVGRLVKAIENLVEQRQRLLDILQAAGQTRSIDDIDRKSIAASTAARLGRWAGAAS